MALVQLRRAENVSGDFFVDSSCIDCDLCRQIAPATFSRAVGQSVVHHQPETADEELAALKALVACPTASIGALGKHDIKAAVRAFPDPVVENIHICGYASEASFGASTYLIRREAGNILVDSPRFAKPLAKRIEEMGGVRFMFLTHRDDVADHDKWAAHFNAERVMHADEVGRSTADIERILTGNDAVALDDEVLFIPTPGHTRGHTVMLYRDRFLFSGDHLWWSPRFKSLYASPNVNWYSWGEQIRSVEKLLDYDIDWVLPGHGRRFHASALEVKQQILHCLTRMKIVARRGQS